MFTIFQGLKGQIWPFSHFYLGYSIFSSTDVMPNFLAPCWSD